MVSPMILQTGRAQAQQVICLQGSCWQGTHLVHVMQCSLRHLEVAQNAPWLHVAWNAGRCCSSGLTWKRDVGMMGSLRVPVNSCQASTMFSGGPRATDTQCPSDSSWRWNLHLQYHTVYQHTQEGVTSEGTAPHLSMLVPLSQHRT